VHGQDHFLEFADLFAALVCTGEASVGRKKCHRAVAPEIPQVPARAVLPVQFHFVEFLDGQQLQGGDAQFLQVGDLFDQPAVGSRPPGSRTGMGGIAAHAGLVDHGLAQRHPQRAVAFPREVVFQDQALGKPPTVEDFPPGDDALAVPPLLLADHGQGVGIQQPLIRVIGLASRAVARASHAVQVVLSGTGGGHVQMPQVAQAVAVRPQLELLHRRLVVGLVEQHQPDPGGVAAENAEMHPLIHHMRPEGQRDWRAGNHVFSFLHGDIRAIQWNWVQARKE